MGDEVINVSVTLSSGGTLAVGTVNHLALKCPSDANGGGLTVLAAGVASVAAIASGSAPVVELVTLGTTSAINGTIGTLAAGAFTAGTVREMTIVNGGWVDSPYYVAFKVAGTAVNASPLFVNGYLNYVMGR